MMNVSRKFCPAIVVMVKTPRAGMVKTRLVPFLNGAQAASLAACFLQDTVSNVSKLTANVIIAFAPAAGREELENLLPEGLLWVEQSGIDLGERLEATIEYAESGGFSPVVVIGADSPTLPPELVQKAIECFRLDEADVTLGATEDGGFYLVGLRQMIPGIFDGIVWSSPAVYRETAANAERLGLERLLRLPAWYDVDTPEDLLRLQREISADKKLQNRAPKTRQWLLAHADLFVPA